MNPAIRTLTDRVVTLPAEAVARLRAGLRGELLTPDADGYHEARTLWNAMIDRRPALIARCLDAVDVARAVRFARDHRILTSIRGGGHNIAGSAMCDGGLVIDLSPMRRVEVDPQRRTARVDAGCTLAEVDRATQAHGLATPLGINSTTGVAGLTLGGGFGWLSRLHGMTVDNLFGAEVVTAEGEVVRASGTENADLFWGLRGGGGNFGVVTAFDFRLHPVGPEVLAGLIIHPLDEAAELLRFFRRFAAGLPDEASVWVVLRKAPPLPVLPAAWHGREVAVLAAFHAGDLDRGERLLEPLRRFGRPIADLIGPQPYVAWQQAFDPMLAAGARNYWKSHDFRSVGDGLVNTLLGYARRLPSPLCDVALAHLGGAAGRVAPSATAYPHRDTAFILNVHARWEDPAEDPGCIAWARDLFRDTAPFATGGAYVNFLTQDEGERVRAAYGANHDRLVALKERYDPENLFRVNHNIQPRGRAPGEPGLTWTPLPS